MQIALFAFLGSSSLSFGSVINPNRMIIIIIIILSILVLVNNLDYIISTVMQLHANYWVTSSICYVFSMLIFHHLLPSVN